MDHHNISKARGLYYEAMGTFFIFKRVNTYGERTSLLLENMAAFPLNETVEEDSKLLFAKLKAGSKPFEEEFNELFINDLNGKAINLTASYYDEGLERGEKLVLVKHLLGCSDLRREESFVEPEDNLGFLTMLLSHFASDFENKKNLELAKALFVGTLHEYADYVVAEILNHPGANLYKSVARILESFMEFERLYLELPSPKKSEFIDVAEALRREKASKSKVRMKQ